MDEKEARSILAAHLARYSQRDYSGLIALVQSRQLDTFDVVGQRGAEYQVEIQFVWDAEPNPDTAYPVDSEPHSRW